MPTPTPRLVPVTTATLPSSSPTGSLPIASCPTQENINRCPGRRGGRVAASGRNGSGRLRVGQSRRRRAHQATIDTVANTPALGRLGQPDDVAGLVAFLAGPGRRVNGQAVYAGGGLI